MIRIKLEAELAVNQIGETIKFNLMKFLIAPYNLQSCSLCILYVNIRLNVAMVVMTTLN